MLRAESAPVNRWVKNVGSTSGCPFEPGVGFATGERAFPNHESNVVSSAGTHLVIKSYRFTLAVGVGAKLDFNGCLPFGRETIRNRAKVSDPVIDQGDRDILLAMRGGRQDGVNSRHLAIIRGGFDGDEVGLGESGEAGENEEGQADKPHFGGRVRVDTYCDHINYNYEKHGLCH